MKTYYEDYLIDRDAFIKFLDDGEVNNVLALHENMGIGAFQPKEDSDWEESLGKLYRRIFNVLTNRNRKQEHFRSSGDFRTNLRKAFDRMFNDDQGDEEQQLDQSTTTEQGQTPATEQAESPESPALVDDEENDEDEELFT